MKRREFLQLGGLTAASALGSELHAGSSRAHSKRHLRDFRWLEASITELQNALTSGEESATSLVKKYLARIEELDCGDSGLRSVIELNPDALSIARSLDQERKSKSPRGPLHGIPILLKDNIATHDRMATTAGSLALLGSIPPHDAFIVKKLRDAGAVILGKTNLSEWANFRSTNSTSGWSARGGQTRNPYSLDRNPSGSSSGSAVAVAANLCSVSVGTETDGSIVSPSSFNGIVGIKPTLGLLSRSGIIPIAHSQDTPGPMARTVRDAAILLGAMVGSDPADAITAASSKGHADYTQFLEPGGLKGARIGVPRKYARVIGPASKVFDYALELMKEQGAEIIDPADLPSFGKFGDAEFDVMLYEFKHGLNKYLAELGPGAPVKSLAELIEFNQQHDEELKFFGQELLEMAEEKGPLTEAAYLEALERSKRLTQGEGIDTVMDQFRLDALVAPTSGPAHITDLIYGDRSTGGSSSPAAVAGYPNITVPAGLVSGLPVGLSFFGRPFTEPKLLRLAYAFEQSTQARTPPKFLQTLPE